MWQVRYLTYHRTQVEKVVEFSIRHQLGAEIHLQAYISGINTPAVAVLGTRSPAHPDSGVAATYSSPCHQYMMRSQLTETRKYTLGSLHTDMLVLNLGGILK